MDAAIRQMLTQTISVAPLTGRSDYGDPVFGAAVSVRARVEPTTKLVLDGAGQRYQAEVLIVAEAGIGIGDRVWLPGVASTETDQARTARSVFPVPDAFTDSIDHLEVYL